MGRLYASGCLPIGDAPLAATVAIARMRAYPEPEAHTPARDEARSSDLRRGGSLRQDGAAAPWRSRSCGPISIEPQSGAGGHHRRSAHVDGRDDLLGVDPLAGRSTSCRGSRGQADAGRCSMARPRERARARARGAAGVAQSGASPRPGRRAAGTRRALPRSTTVVRGSGHR
jgi:hypothetical protein